MKDLVTRVRTALGDEWDSSQSPWAGLIRLYESDEEGFYILACDGVAVPTDPIPAPVGIREVLPLADLARRLRKAVRTSYRLLPPAGGEGQVITQDDGIAVPADLFPRVRQFLMALDDKGVSEKPGKDYEGQVVSEAEVRFHLGTPEERTQVQQRVQARKEARPLVFRVKPQDLQSLTTQPAYVSHALRKCARKTVLAPTAVYRGLSRGDKAPRRLREGWAVCGKPSQCCDNEGRLLPARQGMVFMVYADADGSVFDWDWVQESEQHPGHPLDPDLRFGTLQTEPPEMVLDLSATPPPGGEFDPTVATYSDRGDCIFCYVCDECGYAERINPDLTIFRAFGSNEVTGFKIKNARRILEEEKLFVADDSPDLSVSVQPILLATLKANQKTSVRIYDVIIEAFRKFDHPPAVHLPQAESSQTELAEA